VAELGVLDTNEVYNQRERSMTEALEFFKAIEGKSADQLKEDAKVQRYKERWRNTTFGKKKL